MYVQPTDGKSPLTGLKNTDFFVPKGYSGHAFDAPVEADIPPVAEAAASPATPTAEAAVCLSEPPPESDREGEREPEAVPTGGLLGRVPLLSSLLPPRRGGRGGSSDLLFLGFLFFLLREDGESDLLPLLLLLLFWS